MPAASTDYLALCEQSKRHDCILGLSVVKRQFDELFIRSRKDKKPLVATEQIVGGDHNSAASRLLSRLDRKGWR